MSSNIICLLLTSHILTLITDYVNTEHNFDTYR